MSWDDIVYDPGSTTKVFKFLTDDYKLDILYSGFAGDLFRRTIVIKLDDVPVMIATSETKKSDELFLDILQNTNTTPIGVKLFSPQYSIKRGEMIVTKRIIAAIDDQVILDYIKKLEVKEELYFRTSMFTYNKQSMELKEYILPGLEQIVNKYK
jgi:chorismate-pyruvate lyase